MYTLGCIKSLPDRVASKWISGPRSKATLAISAVLEHAEGEKQKERGDDPGSQLLTSTSRVTNGSLKRLAVVLPVKKPECSQASPHP